MNAPPCRLIELAAGNTRYLEFQTTYSEDWSDEEKREQDILAADVQSATFLLKRKLSDADEEADVEKTLSDGVSVVDGACTVLLNPEDTQELRGEYFATLRLFLVGGSVVDFLDSDYEDIPYVMLQVRQGAVRDVE